MCIILLHTCYITNIQNISEHATGLVHVRSLCDVIQLLCMFTKCFNDVSGIMFLTMLLTVQSLELFLLQQLTKPDNPSKTACCQEQYGVHGQNNVKQFITSLYFVYKINTTFSDIIMNRLFCCNS